MFPTRDRLELLVNAVETVRAQNFDDWEIVIADNASTADIRGYVDDLNDDRIVYLRSDVSLPVTENWNRAIDASKGDYVTMLGDDDGLVPDYFARFSNYIATLEQPDLIYHGAYHFAFPNTLKDAPGGFLHDITPVQALFKGQYEPRILSHGDAESYARAALDMRLHFTFNMQYFIFKREFLNVMREYGSVFQGPYPDFYAANMAFLTADKIGILPQPMTVIGISPKSYGFHHFNNDEKTAVQNLNNQNYAANVDPALAEQLLPGSEMNSQWLVSVALVKQHLLGKKDLALGIERYRRLQILNAVIGPFVRGSDGQILKEALWPKLQPKEKSFYRLVRAILKPAKILPLKWRQILARLIMAMTGQYEEFYWVMRVVIVGLVMRAAGVKVQKPWSSTVISHGQESVMQVYNLLCKLKGAAVSPTRKCHE